MHALLTNGGLEAVKCVVLATRRGVMVSPTAFRLHRDFLPEPASQKYSVQEQRDAMTLFMVNSLSSNGLHSGNPTKSRMRARTVGSTDFSASRPDEDSSYSAWSRRKQRSRCALANVVSTIRSRSTAVSTSRLRTRPRTKLRSLSRPATSLLTASSCASVTAAAKARLRASIHAWERFESGCGAREGVVVIRSSISFPTFSAPFHEFW